MTKPRILIGLRNPIAAFSLQNSEWQTLTDQLGGSYDLVLSESKDAFITELPGADLVVCWKFLAEWYPLAPKLKTIYTPAAGHDWIQADPSGRVAIDFGTFHGPLMRESLLAMMLYFNRRLDRAVADQAQKTWNRDRFSQLPTLHGQHVVILGYGGIGRSCGEVLKAFGCHITGVRRQAHCPIDADSADEIIAMDHLIDALPKADHLVCILPGGDATNGILSSEHFNAMKPGAYLYNLGRGNCYSENDLTTALKHGPLAGAGLDVFATEPLPEDSEIWNLSNALILPHASAICRAYLPAFINELIPKLT